MAHYTWKSGAVADFNMASDWGGALPQIGDTATVTLGEVEITATDALPSELTFAIGQSAASLSTTQESGLSFTDMTTPSGLVINDLGAGGTISTTGIGPVIAGGLASNGQVVFTGVINVGAGDAFSIGIASDSTSSAAATGVFDNQKTINVDGNLLDFAYLGVGQGDGTANSSYGAYAAYGTVNVSYGAVYAMAPDASPANAAIGPSVFNLSNYSELAVITTIFQNSTVNFKDNTDQLLLGQDGVGQFFDGGAINDFQAGDAIGLLSSGAVPESLGYAGNVLTIYSGADQSGSVLGTLDIGGGYTAADFQLTKSSTVEVLGYGYTAQYDITLAPAPTVSVTLTGAGVAATSGAFKEFLGFGDSNIDSGYFLNMPISTNTTKEADYHASVTAGGGLPTSLGGAMNSTLLAQDFGLSANPYNPNTGTGTNYAASGATVTGNLKGSLAPSITSQIDTYLASTGGVANPDALYLLSGGGNDVKIADNMTTAQGEAFMVSEANAYAASIATLHEDGAQYIVLDNLTGADTYGELFNSTLDSDLAADAVPFINGNTEGLVKEIEETGSGSLYGVSYNFTNVTPATLTGSNTTSSTGADQNPNTSLFANSWSLFATQLTSTNAGQTDLWSDDEHLAALGQQIEAAYYKNLIETATPTVGETLTANPVVVNGNGSNFTYQWQVHTAGGWNDISGQTGSSFVVQSADVGDELRVQTTFTDSVTGDVESARSAPTFDVACYCRGTRILTAHGEIAVEALRIGDLAVTASGGSRPVVWIGHRRIDATRHRDPAAVWPVRIDAHAFGENLPRRDIWISPGHNVAWEGVLIPACALVNGVSVAQVETATVEYWHVELDAHDILLAEGLAAESYLDCGNRTDFANGGAFVVAHPDFLPKTPGETCLPLAKQGPAVERAQARLRARVLEQGYVLTADAAPHIRGGRVRIEPVWLSDRRMAFHLPGGQDDIVLHSDVFVPAQVMPDSDDRRALGLCVTRLMIDGDLMPLDDARLSAGWREVEGANAGWRWTDGAARLPAGARIVVVDLGGAGLYWRAPVDAVVALFG